MISIIIPVLNESKTIGSNIKKLLSIKDEDDEVIVVNGLSEDDTGEIVAGYHEILLLILSYTQE